MSKRNDRSNLYQSYQRNLIKATVSTNIGINNHDRLVKAYGAGANRIELLHQLRKQSKFTIWWFAIFFSLGLVCLALDPTGWFNVLDLFILMVNIYMVARGKLAGIYIGVFECVLYSFICLQSGLYGEIVKNMGICVPLNIYSIISWTVSMKKQKQDKYITSKKSKEIIIKKMKKTDYAKYFALFVTCAVGSYFLLRFALKQETALIFGSMALATTIVGKILTAQRYMESYIVFNIGSMICLLMWGQTLIESGFAIGDMTMILYQLACISNDIYAFDLWKSMYRKVAVNGGVILAKRHVNIKKIIKLRRQYKNLHWDKQIDIAKNS